MLPTSPKSYGHTSDALDQYVLSVKKLNQQLHRIQVIENETANSLSRAAAALRSIAAARMQRQASFART